VKSVEALISKVRRPPSLPNWVRLNDRRQDETARRIANFALSSPRHALAKVYQIAADYATFGLSRLEALTAASKIGNPVVRKLGREILSALLPELDRLNLRGIQVFHDMNVPYPIGRGVNVPVKPTFVSLQDGKLTPVFIIGWTSISLKTFQLRLLSTIIYEAILTQEGFEGSDAYVIFAPRIKSAKGDRYVRTLAVTQYERLSSQELRDQFDCFGNALDDAVPIILNELARRGE
jgi:hypothetical protein